MTETRRHKIACYCCNAPGSIRYDMVGNQGNMMLCKFLSALGSDFCCQIERYESMANESTKCPHGAYVRPRIRCVTWAHVKVDRDHCQCSTWARRGGPKASFSPPMVEWLHSQSSSCGSTAPAGDTCLRAKEAVVAPPFQSSRLQSLPGQLQRLVVVSSPLLRTLRHILNGAWKCYTHCQTYKLHQQYMHQLDGSISIPLLILMFWICSIRES